MFPLSRLGSAARALLPITRRELTNFRKSHDGATKTYSNYYKYYGGSAHDDIWHYRVTNTNHSRKTILKAEVIMGIMWYWILFHVYYNWSDIVGHHTLPDPSSWSDKELGIPSDDSD